MLSVIGSCALMGIDAYPITVEVDIASGLPGFTMVGLPDSAVKEARERVFAALKNSGFAIPSKRITINLAPGGIRKEGTSFDLPLALGILLASEQVHGPTLDGLVFLGELSLDGGLRPIRGALSAAIYAKQSGLRGVVVPRENAEEACLVGGPGVFGAVSLAHVLEFLHRVDFQNPIRPAWREMPPPAGQDFLDVKGQEQAKRALEVAAAGAHNFLLVGSPGCGKTLLARRIPSILPPMSEEEGLETTRIHSVAGLLKPGKSMLRLRPFRAPHHSISNHALVGGGGNPPRPGEISLAHNGVLFLDEFPEFHRDVLESLRQPLEEGTITLARASLNVTYPCRFMLGAAMNPCPCGFLIDRSQRCLCRMEEVARYRARISGPLLDRIDIHLELPKLTYGELTGKGPSESSATVRKRVECAREIQSLRFREYRGANLPGLFCNAHMAGTQIARFCPLGKGARGLFKEAVEGLGLSARAYDRILKLGRTIADLGGCEDIGEDHLAEAIHYRCLDRELAPFS